MLLSVSLMIDSARVEEEDMLEVEGVAGYLRICIGSLESVCERSCDDVTDDGDEVMI